jgi:hypothetical protein
MRRVVSSVQGAILVAVVFSLALLAAGWAYALFLS